MSLTPTFRHGLVIGKFYPPHKGHIYLIRAAAQHCEFVTVAILGSSVESLSMAARASWLRECFADEARIRVVAELDDVPIDYESDEIWSAHVGIIRQAIIRADAQCKEQAASVDAVFTSEPYGEELARRMDARSVCLDQTRSLYPVSSTAIREDIVAHWEMLPAPVRAGLAMRVVVLGAESTGTSTLAQDLRTALRARGGIWARTELVPEYGREYSANWIAIARGLDLACQPSDLAWSERDFIAISHEQCRLENEAARNGGPILVCDTDTLATTVWHERYRGKRSAEVERIARALPTRHLYILTDHEGVPFEDDGLRDGAHLRPWMTGRFREVLDEQSVPWIEVTGTPVQRVTTALAAIEALQVKTWSFALPLAAVI